MQCAGRVASVIHEITDGWRAEAHRGHTAPAEAVGGLPFNLFEQEGLQRPVTGKEESCAPHAPVSLDPNLSFSLFNSPESTYRDVTILEILS